MTEVIPVSLRISDKIVFSWVEERLRRRSVSCELGNSCVVSIGSTWLESDSSIDAILSLIFLEMCISFLALKRFGTIQLFICTSQLVFLFIEYVRTVVPVPTTYYRTVPVCTDHHLTCVSFKFPTLFFALQRPLPSFTNRSIILLSLRLVVAIISTPQKVGSSAGSSFMKK